MIIGLFLLISAVTYSDRADGGTQQGANNAATSFCKGEACIEKREYDEGIAHFTEAIRLNSNEFIFYYERAQAYLLKHEYDQAVVDATAAIRSHKTNFLAYIVRGLVFRRRGDFDSGSLGVRPIR